MQNEIKESAIKIKALRKKTGKTQPDFGKTYGMSKRTIQEWEKGIHVPPEYVINLLEEAVNDDVSGESILYEEYKDKNMTIKEMQKCLNMSTAEFAEKFNIPLVTLQSWESGSRKVRRYILELLQRAVIKESKKLKLLPCVECGADAKIVRISHKQYPPTYSVECTECERKIDEKNDIHTAVYEWNNPSEYEF